MRQHKATALLEQDKSTYEFCSTYPKNARPDLPMLSAMCSATLTDIEEAVIELFSAHDASQVTMKQVAATAKVSLQTLYKYFGDKQTLICTVVDRVLERLARRMIEYLYGIDSVQERLRKTLWVCFNFVDTNPKTVMVISAAVPASRYRNISIYENKELIDAFVIILAEGQQRGILNDKVPLYVLFDVFMGFISRLGYMHVIRGTATPINEQFSTLFDIVWRSMAKPLSDA